MASVFRVALGAAIIALLVCPPAYSEEMSIEELTAELKAMKARIVELETRLAEAEAAAKAPAETEKTPTKAGGVRSIETRLQKLEDAVTRPVEGDKWYDRVQISGVVEVEAGYEKVSDNDPATEDETTSDVDLAAVELVVDAKLCKHVDGHVMFKYEDDEVFVDEGFFTLIGNEQFPAYLIGGRQYIPFGNYDSHFVTDPNTLVLGETNEGAAVAGYRIGGEMVDLRLGVFNGRVKELDSDDKIDNLVAAVTVSPLNVVTLGASYTTNIAGSDTLSEFVTSEDGLDSLVGGWAAYASLTFLERFKLIGEYVAAVDEFEAGELYAVDDTERRQPTAWNMELGVGITEKIEAAVRYGGSEDGGDMMPESQYGAVVNFGIFECNLALEYMRGEFADDAQEVDTVTAQFALEF